MGSSGGKKDDGVRASVHAELRFMLAGLFCLVAALQCVLALLGALHVFGFYYGPVTLGSSIFTGAVLFADFAILCRTLEGLVERADELPPTPTGDAGEDEEEDSDRADAPLAPTSPALVRAKRKLNISAVLRLLAKAALIGGGAYLVYFKLTDRSLFDLLALLLPVFFPKIILTLRGSLLKKREGK